MAQGAKTDHNTSSYTQVELLSKLLSQHNMQLIRMGEENYIQFLKDARTAASNPGFDAFKFLREHDSTKCIEEFKEPKRTAHNITSHRLAQPLQQGRST